MALDATLASARCGARDGKLPPSSCKMVASIVYGRSILNSGKYDMVIDPRGAILGGNLHKWRRASRYDMVIVMMTMTQNFLDNAAALDVKRLSHVLGDEGQFDVGKAHALEDRLDARA